MASQVFADRVLETSTTTGTGTYTLAGAVTGFQTFAAVGDGNTCVYVAYEVDANGNPSGGWEVGVGTYTASGTTLARTSVRKSTNSNNAVSWAAGTRRLAVVFDAASAFGLKVVTPVSTTYTQTLADDVIEADPSSGAFTITLLNPTTALNRKSLTVIVVGTSQTNAVTLSTPSGVIGVGGAATWKLVGVNTSLRLVPNGTNWAVEGGGS